MRLLPAFVLLLGLAGPARAAYEVIAETKPYPSVTYTVLQDASVPVVAHVVTVEITSAELTLVSTAPSDRGKKTSDWANENMVHIAVNGDLFDPFTFTPEGLARGESQTWGGTADDKQSGLIRFDLEGGINHVIIERPEDVLTTIGDSVRGVVGGRPLLVDSGAPGLSFGCHDEVTLPCLRAPRTAVGVDADGRKLFLVVVDGWQEASLGLDLVDLALFLADWGAYRALALGLGSSSTLFLKNSPVGVVSSPSDGVERAVANQLGVSFAPASLSRMQGVVASGSLDGPKIVGATVTLDDGVTTDTTNAVGYFELNLRPRYACATAIADGHHPGTSCVQLRPGDMTYNSIVLYPSSLFIDADPAVPDAGVPDARVRVDSPPPGDGGLGTNPDGGGDLPLPAPGCGACRTSPGGWGGRPGGWPGSWTTLILWTCVGGAFRAMLRRRARP